MKDIYKLIVIVIGIHCSVGIAVAQPISVQEVNLPKIGQAVEDLPIGTLLNGKQGKKLSSYKRDLIVLDFMTSTCTNCLASIPKIKKLQESYSGQLKIIPVAYESGQVMTEALKRSGNFDNLSLDFVVNDTVFNRLFPHRTVPHLVWLYKGKVAAVTYGEYLNQKVIEELLGNKTIDLPIKNDYLEFDYTIPLLPRYTDSTRSYSGIMGYLEDADTKFGVQVDSLDGTIRDYAVNVTALPFYFYCYGKIHKIPFMKPSRIKLIVGDKDRFIHNPEVELFEEDWKIKNSISYERTSRLTDKPASRMAAIIEDLDNWYNVRTSFVKQKIPVWVIKEGGAATEQPEQMRSFVSDFAFMADLNVDFPPIINEVDKDRKMYAGKWDSFESLNTLLKRSGLQLIAEDRETTVFLMEERL
ncbi:TlpA family protein disulfide reductase [Sphingobacterium multivorum]|uniref:TlpA family protein disulfide reductase n=1 Tax=Sphingobacterium multivorum TaxID=28454 RepID=UPI003DA34D5D